MVKFIAYAWSSRRSHPALRDETVAALAEARHTGWDGLVAGQRAYLDKFWERADVEIDGDTELQQAVRFGLFHTLQAGARAEQRAIPAKGLTGPGYDGHTFWDSERYILPVLTYAAPQAAADALRWRHSTLDLARERAVQLGLAGAVFPWRTIRGHECSGYWPAGTAAFHVSGDVADAVIRYLAATRDEAFELEAGLELLIETARLWRSLGHHDPAGRFRIDGVTGPDEYSAIADNNVYTNLLAQRNMRAAADAVARHPRHAAALGADPEEAATWRDAARDVVIPWDEALGVHPQSEGFTDHQVWDFEHTTPDQYPLLLHFPYFDLYRKQVVKQADLVLAMHIFGDAFSDEEKARNFAYYEALTVRDSSLSAATQAVVAAEVGHLELAYDYLRESALIDLHDLEHNARDGLHIGALAGALIAAVAGFGGLRDHEGKLGFSPRLPARLERLAFRLVVCGSRLSVEATKTHATYALLEGRTARLEPSRRGDHRVGAGARDEGDPALRQPPGAEPAAGARAGAARRRRQLTRCSRQRRGCAKRAWYGATGARSEGEVMDDRVPGPLEVRDGNESHPLADARRDQPTAAAVRKPVTVVFCDLVESTRLSRQFDPEALRGILLRYFEAMQAVIERHGGTVEKFIGDAVMAVFGVPVVHEDDALRAVRAAAEMRDSLAALNDDLGKTWGVRLEGRIGINTGEVVAGDHLQGHVFVTGRVVNVAKRLEEAAATSEILISTATHELVRDAVVTEPAGDRIVKGGEAVDALRLVDGARARRRAHAPLRFAARRPRAAAERAAERLRDRAARPRVPPRHRARDGRDRQVAPRARVRR